MLVHYDHPTFTSFLEEKDDDDLLSFSSLEVETKLVSIFCARPSGRLLDKISSAWGLSPWLQTELFIFASILDRVENDDAYSLTSIRRKRLILAFERSIREMDKTRQAIPVRPSVKKYVVKENEEEDIDEPVENTRLGKACILVKYFKECLIDILSAQFALRVSFAPIKKQFSECSLKECKLILF